MVDRLRLRQIHQELLTHAQASTDPREARRLIDAAQQLGRLTGETLSGPTIRDLLRAAIDRQRQTR